MPLWPLGILFLDPATTLPLPSVASLSNRDIELRVPVPLDRRLVGVTLSLQGLVVDTSVTAGFIHLTASPVGVIR
jgi:hypothetical protein